MLARGREVGPRKLRSSCDGCGDAKVKCNRGHPVCGRCTTLSLTCVYGISRRFGKPPRKRRISNTHSNPENRMHQPSSAESREYYHAVNSGTQGTNEPAQAGLVDLMTDVFAPSYDTDAAVGTDEENQLISAFYPSITLESWPQLDSLELDLETPSDPALESLSTASSSSDMRESHNCPRESYEIFRDLICPTPSLHAPESNSITISAQLDHVLHFNRNAIDRLSRLLKCPCAKSGHRAMVHASIVSRILIWYQQAAGWTCSSSWGRRPSILTESTTFTGVASPQTLLLASEPATGTSTSTSSQPSLVQTTGFAVEDVPVSVGTFSIEDHNIQAAFRNHLILVELKKTASLIDLFFSQDCGESASNGVADLHSHLGAWLRSEHARTVKILKSRLIALNRTLVS